MLASLMPGARAVLYRITDGGGTTSFDEARLIPVAPAERTGTALPHRPDDGRRAQASHRDRRCPHRTYCSVNSAHPVGEPLAAAGAGAGPGPALLRWPQLRVHRAGSS